MHGLNAALLGLGPEVGNPRPPGERHNWVVCLYDLLAQQVLV